MVNMLQNEIYFSVVDPFEVLFSVWPESNSVVFFVRFVFFMPAIGTCPKEY